MVKEKVIPIGSSLIEMEKELIDSIWPVEGAKDSVGEESCASRELFPKENKQTQKEALKDSSEVNRGDIQNWEHAHLLDE